MILSYRNVCLFYIPVDSPKRLSHLPSSFGLVSQVAVGCASGDRVHGPRRVYVTSTNSFEEWRDPMSNLANSIAREVFSSMDITHFNVDNQSTPWLLATV